MLIAQVWTRFFPISYKIQKLIADGEIGDVRRVYADFGMALDLPSMSSTLLLRII